MKELDKFHKIYHPRNASFSIWLTLALSLFFLLSNWSVADAAKRIRQSSEIPVIAAGQQGGQYSTNYLTINYSYARVGNNFNISGTVQFSSMVQSNWTEIRGLYLGLVFADGQGQVLEEHGLNVSGNTSNIGAPLNFKNSFTIPAGTKYMAFKCNGQAIGTGPGNQPTSFWIDPIKGFNF